MSYRVMRLSKYYDAIRSNNAFMKTSFNQKFKISYNIIKFLITNINKPLIIKNKPVIAQIEPTSLCNLRCKMCVRDKIGVPIGSMSFDNFKKILDKLNCLFKLHLSGQGEPFINRDIFRMIKYANNRGISVFFTTNGTVLNEKIISDICDVDIGEIGISVDSTKKDIYEKIRKGAKFEKVKENIKNLVSEIKRNKKKTIVSISTVIMNENINEITEFVKLAKELGVKKIGFQRIQKKEDYLDKYGSDVKIKNISNINKKISEANKLAQKYGIQIIFDEEKSPGCIWPWRSIYITWNGYVTPCCKILDYREPYFGNILNEDFWEIWNGKKYQMFRKLLRERKSPVQCRGCSMI